MFGLIDDLVDLTEGVVDGLVDLTDGVVDGLVDVAEGVGNSDVAEGVGNSDVFTPEDLVLLIGAGLSISTISVISGITQEVLQDMLEKL